ncbi:MAG: hypothetical protein ACP5RT_02930 [Candidatus Micrarchaeia archaeon]
MNILNGKNTTDGATGGKENILEKQIEDYLNKIKSEFIKQITDFSFFKRNKENAIQKLNGELLLFEMWGEALEKYTTRNDWKGSIPISGRMHGYVKEIVNIIEGSLNPAIKSRLEKLDKEVAKPPAAAKLQGFDLKNTLDVLTPRITSTLAEEKLYEEYKENVENLNKLGFPTSKVELNDFIAFADKIHDWFKENKDLINDNTAEKYSGSSERSVLGFNIPYNEPNILKLEGVKFIRGKQDKPIGESVGGTQREGATA